MRQLKEDKIDPVVKNDQSIFSVSWLGWRAIAAVLGGFILRLWMLSAFPQVSGDALIYGNIAKSLLQKGQFAITDGSGVAHSTLIRLPGYPLFLATCFRLFGMEHYNAVIFTQITLELVACLLLADFVRRIWSPRAGLNTLWLAAMCPFTAVYASAPLTESLTFDMICLALWSLERYLACQRATAGNQIRQQAGWGPLLLFTLAISYAALLRPDGPLLAIALWPALLFSRSLGVAFTPALRRALLVGALAVLPFVPWTIRNWQTFHVFEPLAPRYATDPDEDPHRGWQHWVRTWCLDFASTYEVYWNIPDNPLDVNTLPERALGSGEERAQTLALIADYNDNQEITPAIDARFRALAEQRTARYPLRTLVLLPLGRLGDMLLRPRVENLTIDLRWWEYNQHRPETRFSWGYAAVNLIFLMLGVVGFCYRPRYWPYMAAYILLRCALLLTVEAPETRYTLEFFPILFVMGGIALQQIFRSRKKQIASKTASG
ncbi:ArnT family glycosyltransferase [Acidicapsa ligni]|uniref:ArnT family glycosyltransferase n=1 Tax=Acidicapsa ligni TaxID=542300 RepID=UPI0021E02AAB|nr:glycosyltransferase family 39 protein [Acidicapsa ligni]